MARLITPEEAVVKNLSFYKIWEASLITEIATRETELDHIYNKLEFVKEQLRAFE